MLPRSPFPEAPANGIAAIGFGDATNPELAACLKQQRFTRSSLHGVYIYVSMFVSFHSLGGYCREYGVFVLFKIFLTRLIFQSLKTQVSIPQLIMQGKDYSEYRAGGYRVIRNHSEWLRWKPDIFHFI